MDKTLIIDFSESAFNNLTEMIVYWQNHITEVKDNEKMLDLLLSDLSALNYKNAYIQEI